MKKFKESLMENKKLESLDFESESVITNTIFGSTNTTWGELNSNSLEIFLKDWKNETLKELKLNCKRMTKRKKFITESSKRQFLQ
jgi:hypothetical protein